MWSDADEKKLQAYCAPWKAVCWEEQSANLPAVTADAIWSTGEKPKSKNSFYGNEIFLTYNRYAPFQRSTFVFQANAKTEPAIIDLDRVMWRLLKNSVELRLA